MDKSAIYRHLMGLPPSARLVFKNNAWQRERKKLKRQKWTIG